MCSVRASTGNTWFDKATSSLPYPEILIPSPHRVSLGRMNQAPSWARQRQDDLRLYDRLPGLPTGKLRPFLDHDTRLVPAKSHHHRSPYLFFIEFRIRPRAAFSSSLVEVLWYASLITCMELHSRVPPVWAKSSCSHRSSAYESRSQRHDRVFR